MKLFAQILNEMLHWKFEAEECPEFADDIVIIDITGVSPEPQEGWGWSGGQFVPPPSATPAQVWSLIKGERERRTQTGGYQAAGKWFHSDVFSRSQQLGLALLGANIPAGLQWKTMDGSFVDMTPTLAQQIFAAAAASDQAIFAAAEVHRVAMEASADPSAYAYTAGWPPVFGE